MKIRLRLLLLLALLPLTATAAIPTLGDQPQFLPPDQAFQFSAWANPDGTITANWVITEDYYLYKKQFRFSSPTPGVTFGQPQFPEGETHTDEYFGTQTVFRGALNVTLPVTSTGGNESLQLRVQYQGCADAGLCYPPQTKMVQIALPEGMPSSNAPAPNGPMATSGELSEQGKLGQVISTAPLWSVMLVFFGAGLLLTFTPCVLPMVPIISSLVVGQGRETSTSKAFLVSLVYVLAMAFTYTVAGALVAYFGGNLNAWFQNIWVLSAFSLIFVLLAISMFGAFDLQMPASVQAKLSNISNNQQGGTLAGAAIMGLLSALIVGPCITAPLVAAFIAIGQTGDPTRGALALFSMSIGMGVPLLIVGTSAGKLLPRAGNWMNAIKAVFGFLLLGLAVWFMARVVPGWLSMLGWVVLITAAGLYFLDLKPASQGWRVLLKTVGVLLTAWGLALLIGLGAGSTSPLQPLEGFGGGASVEEEHLNFQRIKTVEDLQREVAQAAAQNRPVMLDFYADWCISCMEMEAYTFSDPAVQAALSNAVLLQADVTANDAKDQALLDHFGLYGPPAIIFYNAQGERLPNRRVVGFMGAEEFTAHVRETWQE